MNELVKTELYAPLTIGDVKHQINLIQSLMKDVMKEDEHFGVIPGCGSKMVLLKAGAEKLSFVFRHTVKFNITTTNLDKGHKEYTVITEIKSRNGRYLGEGVGCCSTQESKYKYRWDDTEQDVPKEYWKSRDQSLIGGDSYTVRKKENKWLVFQRIEHDNPADYYNTCLKIAKKRSMVDAEITVCAASDIFTQDLEEGVVEAKVIETKDDKLKQGTQSRVEKELKKQSDENVKDATRGTKIKKTTKDTPPANKTAPSSSSAKNKGGTYLTLIAKIKELCNELDMDAIAYTDNADWEKELGWREAKDMKADLLNEKEKREG